VTNPDRPNLVSSETLERLRTAGFSEHEIDDLLARAREMLARARAATAAPPSPATPQPAAAPFSGQQASMTCANSKFNTILEQARRAIPAVQGEIGIAGEDKAAASRPFRAFAALAIIPAVVAVLGFGVSLELTKLQAETALVAELRQKGDADEATYRTEITQQTALVAGLRQVSEAKEAEYRAEISKQTELVADIRQRAEAALADVGIPIAREPHQRPRASAKPQPPTRPALGATSRSASISPH
jgi:hypothetical protein